MTIGLLLLLTLSGLFSLGNFFHLNQQPNSLIGFKTKRSKASEKSWQFAQNIFFPITFLCLILLFILFKHHLFNEQWYSIFSLLSYLIVGGLTEFLLSQKSFS